MKIYCGFNKCPDCGAIERRKGVKRTRNLCPSCLKKFQAMKGTGDLEADLLMVIAFLNRAVASLRPESGNMKVAEEWLKAALKDLREIIETIQL